MDQHLSPRVLAAAMRSPEANAHLAACARCRVAAKRVQDFMATMEDDHDPMVESLVRSDTGPVDLGAARAELAPGTRIERYVIEAEIGAGGIARVYRARHASLGSLHAIKVLQTGSRDVAERLLAEGRVQATLRSRHIVPVTDVIDVDGSPGLVMELIDGPSLDAVLRSGKLAIENVDRIARGLFAGVGAAHRAGLIHRDLKPGNILLAEADGERMPRITDFGLAKVLAGPRAAGFDETRTDMTMGTPRYMSPEQIRSAKLVDQRTDLWALGAILYELVTGSAAFDGADLMDLFIAVTAGRYRPVRELAPAAPERMIRAIEAALVVDREHRVASVEALAAIWSGSAGATVKSPPAAPRRRTSVVAAAGATGLLGLAALGWWIWPAPAAECGPLAATYMPMTSGTWWRYTMTDPDTRQPMEDKLLRVDEVLEPGKSVRMYREEGERTGYRWLERHGDVVGWVHDRWFDKTGATTKESVYDPIYTRVDETCEHRALGARWTENYTETKAGSGDSTHLRVEWEVQAVDERVVVPAGTFKTLRVHRLQYDDAGHLKEQTYWFASGIGKVKEDSPGIEYEELIDFHVEPPE
jgi:serine/threonine-protein kinase